ncbi:sulfur oxidation c-type cytochrome SoxA [Ectothiorhodospiraceae bacterium 2226]|nr:sulfur oxidation c-type cytochrome SoxA [Ectothiorhodospiraceae bacterium 2226]
MRSGVLVSLFSLPLLLMSSALLTAEEQERDVQRVEGEIPPPWESRAIPESQGRVVEVDGERVQMRYQTGGFARETGNYEDYPTHAYETVTFPGPRKVEMPALAGDAERGHELFRSRDHGPCVACHLIPDPEVWPMGNVGPDMRTYGHREMSDEQIYQIIYDPRAVFGTDTPMPPLGLIGVLSEQEIVDIVTYLQQLTGDPPGTPEDVTDDKQWNPFTRDVVRPDYGDPLDPFENPGLSVTEDVAVPLWDARGPKGQSCADCHGALGPADELRPLGVIATLEDVGARYPRWFDDHERMMSVEDFLAVHSPQTTGHELPAQGLENITMSVLVRMQANGQPYQLETDDPNVQAAIDRGEQLFHRPVGQRQHACADCHTERGGADKFLGGRMLANVNDGMINHPYWRTNEQALWDIRVRMQWCMTPLGTNYLPGDSPEYADLETYIISKQQGMEVLVPRQAH